MKFHPNLGPKTADLGWVRVELLPGRPYCVRHAHPQHTVGIAIERQRGVHAFGCDRLQDYDTWTGTLAYTPPALETYSESDTGGEYLALRFSNSGKLGWRAPGQRQEGRPSFGGQRQVLELALQLRRALLAPAVGTETLEFLSARMILLAQDVLGRPNSRAAADPLDRPRIARVLDCIEAGIANPLRLSELAATAELPLLRFVRSFTRAVGLTPHAYVMERRLQYARRLLGERQISLAETAVACGFAHQSHLGVALKRAFGATPGQLRR